MRKSRALRSSGKAAAVWAALIAVLLLLPAASLPTAPWWIPWSLSGWLDSVIHALLFFVQAWLLLGASLPYGPMSDVGFRLWLCLFYAIVLELLQIPVPGRSFQFIDILFAGLGICAAIYLDRRSARAAGRADHD